MDEVHCCKVNHLTPRTTFLGPDELQRQNVLRICLPPIGIWDCLYLKTVIPKSFQNSCTNIWIPEYKFKEKAVHLFWADRPQDFLIRTISPLKVQMCFLFLLPDFSQAPNATNRISINFPLGRSD